MPHIIIKMHKGRSKEMINDMVEKVASAIMESLNVKESSVSVGVEEFEPARWKDEVYQPDIIEKNNTIYKKPGY